MTARRELSHSAAEMVVTGYRLPMQVASMPWRIVLAVIAWPVLTAIVAGLICSVLLGLICWFLLIGWWLPAVIRPRIRW